MYSVSIKFGFSAAHRLMSYRGKCSALHGHSYKAEITIGCPNLDKTGFVVDFTVLKRTIVTAVMARYDHNTVLHKDDPLAVFLLDEVVRGLNNFNTPVCLLSNPTAENIAAEIAKITAEHINEWNKQPVQGQAHLCLVTVAVREEDGTEACFHG